MNVTTVCIRVINKRELKETVQQTNAISNLINLFSFSNTSSLLSCCGRGRCGSGGAEHAV